jgi:hypothetical protein
MEDRTMSLESVRVGDESAAAAHFATYETAYTSFALGVNVDLQHINALFYSFMSPVWRALLGKLIRESLPFEVVLPPPGIADPTPAGDEEGIHAR